MLRIKRLTKGMKERQMDLLIAFIGYVNYINKFQQFKVSVQKYAGSNPAEAVGFF
jgi:hypothetical protein